MLRCRTVVTPIIGMAGGQPDFSAVNLSPVGIGDFVNAVISFLIKAAVVYYGIVKPFTALLARLNPPPAPGEPPPPPPEVKLLTEIRDLLHSRPAAA